MRRTRNAKIVATLGPASADRQTIEALFRAGADVFRLNFSHGTQEDHRQRLDIIRAIERAGPDFAETRVVNGGPLSDRKGVNVPGVVLPLSALTDKDRKDLDYGLSLGVDWVALSFVQRPEDIHPVLCHEVVDVPEMSDLACQTAVNEGFATAGQSIVISAGILFSSPGATNLLRIAQIA